MLDWVTLWCRCLVILRAGLWTEACSGLVGTFVLLRDWFIEYPQLCDLKILKS